MDFMKARDILLEGAPVLQPKPCPIAQATGLILAEDFRATSDTPPFDRSPLDGYALRAEDIVNATRNQPVSLEVLEEVAAGHVGTVVVGPGQCTKILTGAPIPPGADCVIKYEETLIDDCRVQFFSPTKSGSNIVRRGEDVTRGQVLASSGDRIDFGLLAVLASQGVSHPLVYPKPRVALLATGDEIVPVKSPLAFGQIYNTNRYLLGAALESQGFDLVDLGIVKDQVEEIQAAIKKGLDVSDALVITGGVSVGDYDHTPQAIQDAGVHLSVRNVRLKPGGYCAYGFKGGKLVCGLSGNPVSAFTNFQLIGMPVLKKMAGRADFVPEWIPLSLAEDFNKKSPKGRAVLGRLDFSKGLAQIHLEGPQGNANVFGLIGADALALIPPESAGLPAGTILKGFIL